MQTLKHFFIFGLIGFSNLQLISAEFQSEPAAREFMSIIIGKYGCNASIVAQCESTWKVCVDVLDTKKDYNLPREQLWIVCYGPEKHAVMRALKEFRRLAESMYDAEIKQECPIELAWRKPTSERNVYGRQQSHRGSSPPNGLYTPSNRGDGQNQWQQGPVNHQNGGYNTNNCQ